MQEITALNNTLIKLKIDAQCSNFQKVGNYCFYDLILHNKTKIKHIENFKQEIGLDLKLNSPNIKIIPSEGIIRLQFYQNNSHLLKFFELNKMTEAASGHLQCLLGQTADGKPLWMDLANNPHMIVAGATGSGKSILLHNLIANLIIFNDQELVLIDPKNTEFFHYKNLKKITVVDQFDDALSQLQKLRQRMDLRYQMVSSGSDINTLNPIVLIIDEFADLIIQDDHHEFKKNLLILAQKCRAAKIYIVLATQRPSVDILNGVIKANFPVRLACRVSSAIDARVIGIPDAENLIGKGDAFIKDHTGDIQRLQIAYTDPQEICSFIQNLN